MKGFSIQVKDEYGNLIQEISQESLTVFQARRNAELMAKHPGSLGESFVVCHNGSVITRHLKQHI